MTFKHTIVDFAAPFKIEDIVFFPAVNEPHHFVYFTPELEIAPCVDKRKAIDFSVEAVRGESPFLPPEPYGVLDFRVRPIPLADAVIVALREQHPHAFVSPLVFQRGYLRLEVISGRDTLTDEELAQFEQAMLLVSNGLDSARLIRRLSSSVTSLLKGVLQNKSLLFAATAEMEALGQAQKLDAKVAFEKQALSTALANLVDSKGYVTHEDIVAFWMQDMEHLPIVDAHGFDTSDSEQLARTLADWTVAHFASSIAPSGKPIEPTWQLAATSTRAEIVRWNLLHEQIVPRVVSLRLNPFAAAQKVVDESGLDAIWHETVVPPIETGLKTLIVGTNLPPALHGIVKLGVHLEAQPNPPLRPHALTESHLFEDAEALHRFNWRFSPQETVHYDYSTFVLIRQGGAMRRLVGTSIAHDSTYLLVGVDAYPLEFVTVRADEALLKLAQVTGVCRSKADNDASEPLPDAINFNLTLAQPQVTLALPPTVRPHFEFVFEACSLSDNSCLSLGSFAAKPLMLNLLSFKEFGQQAVEIVVDFDSDMPLLALRFLPENVAEDEATVLAFRPESPSREWRYFAASPFHNGYRYRLHEDTGAWSEVQSPDATLVIQASKAAKEKVTNDD
jgi:hypothetical protein